MYVRHVAYLCCCLEVLTGGELPKMNLSGTSVNKAKKKGGMVSRGAAVGTVTAHGWGADSRALLRRRSPPKQLAPLPLPRAPGC